MLTQVGIDENRHSVTYDVKHDCLTIITDLDALRQSQGVISITYLETLDLLALFKDQREAHQK